MLRRILVPLGRFAANLVRQAVASVVVQRPRPKWVRKIAHPEYLPKQAPVARQHPEPAEEDEALIHPDCVHGH